MTFWLLTQDNVVYNVLTIHQNNNSWQQTDAQDNQLVWGKEEEEEESLTTNTVHQSLLRTAIKNYAQTHNGNWTVSL